MREKLATNVPLATVLDGSAEGIPLEAKSLDAVVVAQAFHWFDGERALTEIHRVLRPGGRLGLVWNVRDASVEWVSDLAKIIDPHQGDSPHYGTGKWRDAFARTSLFTTLEMKRFNHVHLGPPEMVVDRVGSTSFIAALSETDRERVLDRVRQLLSTHAQTKGQKEIAFPYRTEVFVCARQA